MDGTSTTRPLPTLLIVPARFLTLDDVAQEMCLSSSQVYALVRHGDLVAVKIGGRGQWRVERRELEEWIARLYTDTREWIAGHPFTAAAGDVNGDDAGDVNGDDAGDET